MSADNMNFSLTVHRIFPSFFLTVLVFCIIIFSGCGSTDTNVLCRNEYITVSRIYSSDTDTPSANTPVQLFYYIEDNRNMQRIDNRAFYISESGIKTSESAFFRGFTDAESEESYNYASTNKLNGTLLTHQKHSDGDYYIVHKSARGTIAHYINRDGKLFAYNLPNDGSEHDFPNDFQCDNGKVYLFFYEDDGISIETIDLPNGISDSLSVDIPAFGKHHIRHSFSGNCYYNENGDFGVIVNYPKGSEHRDELFLYNNERDEYCRIPEKDGIDDFFIGETILLVRVNENVLKLSYYEPDGSLTERHDINLSDYIDGNMRISYRPTKLGIYDNTLHILIDSDSSDVNYWLQLDMQTNTVSQILKIDPRSPFEMMDYEFLREDGTELILHEFN